jgi:diguanylate cyclase (GGDEF)-like protein
MVDLDNFKRINDTHGHKSGDNVLKSFSAVCRLAFREIDIVGRIGGEEFAILLPETSKDNAVEAAERLRTKIASTNIQTDENLAIEFTASIGIANLSSKDDTLDVLLSHADNALYKAKNAGRNQVRVYENHF